MTAIEVDNRPDDECRRKLEKLKEEALETANIQLFERDRDMLPDEVRIAMKLNRHTNLSPRVVPDRLRDITAQADIG